MYFEDKVEEATQKVEQTNRKWKTKANRHEAETPILWPPDAKN